MGNKKGKSSFFDMLLVLIVLVSPTSSFLRTQTRAEMLPGDINGDLSVNILDAILLANAFGSVPSDPNWNPNADLDGNDIVNILDAVILSGHFGDELAQVNLAMIESGLTSPSGYYRWLDVADQAYSSSYRDSYNYSQATVAVTYRRMGDSFVGELVAQNLKPNFAYQLKLVGTSGTADNELIGLSGRWWQEEWNGSAWINGWNLNNKGNGTSPNPNDITYFNRCSIEDSSSPTGYHYCYTGYLLFEYFITDQNGGATLQFETGSCYHVLWKTSQRSRTVDDGPVRTVAFDPDPSQPAYDVDYPNSTISIFGEWERLPMGSVHLPSGQYNCQIVLTEESFHGTGPLAGNWASAMSAAVSFQIT